MSVYVDNAIYKLARMMMCHMVADTTDELLAMADEIGVDRKWIQAEGTYREHFDICKSKRLRAIRAGAVEISGRELGAILNARRKGAGR